MSRWGWVISSSLLPSLFLRTSQRYRSYRGGAVHCCIVGGAFVVITTLNAQPSKPWSYGRNRGFRIPKTQKPDIRQFILSGIFNESQSSKQYGIRNVWVKFIIDKISNLIRPYIGDIALKRGLIP